MRIESPRRALSGLLVLSLTLVLAGPSLTAATLNYQESVSGDLPEISPWVLLNLDVGANTVSGSSRLTVSSTAITFHDFDSFRFVVPVGTELTSIQFDATVTSATNPGVVNIDTFFDLGPAPFTTVLGHELISIEPGSLPAGASLSSNLPVGPGEYLLFQGQLQGTFNEDVSWDYTYTLDVVATPLPAVAPMGAALLLLGVMLRRKFGSAA